MMYFYIILNLEMKIQSALEQTADVQAAYAAIKDYHDEDGSFSYLACGMDQIFANANVVRLLGKEYLDSSWIEGGSRGLSFYQSSFLKNGNTINLIVNYTIKIPFFHISNIKIVQCTERRIWLGDDSSKLSDQETLSTDCIYATPDGIAYHLYKDCSYIDVKLKAVNAENIKNLRNEEGSIYYPCESCHPQEEGTVYITSYGNRYHKSKKCKAIEKHVMKISQNEIGNRHLCSKCAERAGG